MTIDFKIPVLVGDNTASFIDVKLHIVDKQTAYIFTDSSNKAIPFAASLNGILDELKPTAYKSFDKFVTGFIDELSKHPDSHSLHGLVKKSKFYLFFVKADSFNQVLDFSIIKQNPADFAISLLTKADQSGKALTADKPMANDVVTLEKTDKRKSLESIDSKLKSPKPRKSSDAEKNQVVDEDVSLQFKAKIQDAINLVEPAEKAKPKSTKEEQQKAPEPEILTGGWSDQEEETPMVQKTYSQPISQGGNDGYRRDSAAQGRGRGRGNFGSSYNSTYDRANESSNGGYGGRGARGGNRQSYYGDSQRNDGGGGGYRGGRGGGFDQSNNGGGYGRGGRGAGFY